MVAALFATILVTFPAENQKLPVTDRTYVIGAAETNRKERLYLNGVEIDIYRTGAFLAMAKTQTGTNTLTFTQGTNTLVRHFIVASPPPPSGSQPSTFNHPPSRTIRMPTSAFRRMRCLWSSRREERRRKASISWLMLDMVGAILVHCRRAG